jgi:hypothetical protein
MLAWLYFFYVTTPLAGVDALLLPLTFSLVLLGVLLGLLLGATSCCSPPSSDRTWPCWPTSPSRSRIGGPSHRMARRGGRHRRGRAPPGPARQQRRGGSFGPPAALDPARPEGVTQRRAAPVAVGDGFVVVFEDDRAGEARIVAVDVDAHRRVGPAWRVDDAPVGADARSPTAVRWEHRLVVAWQDTRADLERVRSIELPLPTPADGSRPWRCA